MNTADTIATIATLEASVDAMEATLRRMQGVITDATFVIQLTDSGALYLIADGGKFRAGSITNACCYSPERAEGAAEHVRTHSAGVFDSAKPVLHREALRREIAAGRSLIERLKNCVPA